MVDEIPEQTRDVRSFKKSPVQSDELVLLPLCVSTLYFI
jgi:hypothetical protein